MNGEVQIAELLYLLCIMVLVVSALVVRRIPVGHSLRMLGVWFLIFLAGFIAFSFKDEVLGLAERVASETRAERTGVQVGEELRIKQAPDGHFWVDARINGMTARFLVDSGATTTSISRETADRADIDTAGSLPALVRTANGTVEVQRGRARRLEVGHIERENIAVHVSDAFGDINVLGMNFLSSLRGWRVEGSNLILTP